MATVQQLEKVLPFAHDLGLKYELRVLSHLICSYIALTTVDNALTLAQWDRCYALVLQMVCELNYGMNAFLYIDSIGGSQSCCYSWILQHS